MLLTSYALASITVIVITAKRCLDGVVISGCRYARSTSDSDMSFGRRVSHAYAWLYGGLDFISTNDTDTSSSR